MGVLSDFLAGLSGGCQGSGLRGVYLLKILKALYFYRHRETDSLKYAIVQLAAFGTAVPDYVGFSGVRQSFGPSLTSFNDHPRARSLHVSYFTHESMFILSDFFTGHKMEKTKAGKRVRTNGIRIDMVADTNYCSQFLSYYIKKMLIGSATYKPRRAF